MTRPRWTTVSRNERAVSVGDRHFFAMRCNPSTLWHIEELDVPVQTNEGRIIQVVADQMTTRDVTRWLKEQMK